MPIELTDVELEEISLVTAGDDPLAKVTIFKNKQKDDNMDEDMKKLQTEKDDLEKQLADANAKITDLEKQLVDTKATITKEEETIDFGGEKVAKSAIPAVVLKELEETRKAKEQAGYVTKAKQTIPNFRGTDEQKAQLIKAVNDDETLLEMLRAADVLFSELFTEVGKKTTQETMEPSDRRW